MRITCIFGPFAPLPPVLGGAVERIFLALCGEFARQGHQVTLISRQFQDFAKDEIVDGVRFLRIPSSDAPKNKILYRILDALYAIRACVALPRSDITITHSVSLPLIIPKAKAGKIYVSVARFPKGQMGFYRRVDRLQAVSTHIANSIITQSPAVRDIVKAIPNALSDVFAKSIVHERGERRKEIIFVGRVAREKGIDLLVRAFARLAVRHPDWRLVVVGPHEARHGGDGAELLAELKALATQVKERVEFVGPMFDEAALVARLRGAEIFVYPSVAARGEASPLAPVEAMGCGCAVVVSDLNCFSDYLEADINGLKFDQNDPSGTPLETVLERLILSPELRDRLAAEATRTAARFTPDMVAQLFIADFEKLVGNQHG